MVLFHVLGPLEIRGRDGVMCPPGSGKPARVLAAFLVQPNAWVAVDRLIDLTWHAQAVPASAEANLKTYIWQLRQLLPEHADAPWIESRAGAYRLHVADDELDAQCAARCSAEASDALAAGAPATALSLVEQALGLWRGRPFEGLDLVADDAVEQLEELHRKLRGSLAEAQLGLGRTEEAIATLRGLTADDPLREDVWAQLIRTLHMRGRPAQALATYHQARRVLATELGVRPGPELTGAFRTVLGDSRGDTPAIPPRRELPRAPRSFTGRDRELRQLTGALSGVAPATLVTGSAGTGKTALVVYAAHRLSDRFPDGQFFVDLHGRGPGPLDPAAVSERLLRGLGFPPGLIPSDTDERAALWRSELAGRKALLVFDDAADPADLEPLLPATGASATLITSRDHTCRIDDVGRIHLETFPGGMAPTRFDSAVRPLRTADKAHRHAAWSGSVA
jgi:DNA-binding SARP family transcriptional activator